MKQVEEEYFKADEKSPHAPTTVSGSSANPNALGNPEIYPLSPDKAVSDMKNNNPIPGAVERAMNSLIKAQRTIDTTKAPTKEENEVVIPDGAKATPLPSPETKPSRRTSILRTESTDDVI
jgi:hypothetical protein